MSLIAHEAADVVQGTLNTYNKAVANEKEVKNFMQEVYKWIGNKIGGETGEKIANGVFTVADIGLGFVSVGGTIKHLAKIKQLDKGTDIAKYLVKIGADGGKKALTIINPKNIYKAGKEVAGNIGTKTINLAGDLKKELAQIAEIYRKQGKGTVALSSNGAGEAKKIYDTLAEYAKMKKVDDVAKLGSNTEKWIDESGNIKWPPNNGAIDGTEKKIVLTPGYQFDRHGYDGGSFVSPVGIPYEMRALAPGTEAKPYKVFEVIKPVRGEGSIIAPWFNQPGGGIQFKLDQSIEKLIEAGKIVEVKK